MAEEADRCRRALLACPEMLTELASRLEVEEEILHRLGVGWKEENCPPGHDGEWADYGPAWTFPVQNGSGEIIGIKRHFEDETIEDRMISGSRRGLYVPHDWQGIGGLDPPSRRGLGCCRTAHRGILAIGRPKASRGVEYLAEMLGHVDRAIVVVGERDQNEQGRWPGKECAEATARALGRRLERRVDLRFPPPGFKNFREFVNALTQRIRGN